MNSASGETRDLGIPGIQDAVLVGSGGSARVYRATQGQLGRTVAVKILVGTEEAERKQFDRESMALGQLSSHPGIVSVHDAGFNTHGEPYLVLQYCAGGPLTTRLENGVMPWREAVGFLAPVAATLSDAHDQGFVHRDLKPDNILLDGHGRPLIGDFGLARLVATVSSAPASMVGFTPGYVAPETVSGAQAIRASDVYSLGGTLFSLVSGEVPFVDTDSVMNIVALAKRIAEEPVPDLRPRGIPHEVCAVIEQCMAKDPTARPTAQQLAQQLQALTSAEALADAGTTQAPLDNNTISITPEQLSRNIESVEPEALGFGAVVNQPAASAPAAAAPAGVDASHTQAVPGYEPVRPYTESGRTHGEYQAAPSAARRFFVALGRMLLGLLVLGIGVGIGVAAYLLLRPEEDGGEAAAAFARFIEGLGQ